MSDRTLFDFVEQAERERETRDVALTTHKAKHPELVTKLRIAAREAYARLGCPISANDIRHVLEEEGFAGDRRILGVAFGESYWTRVGDTRTDCAGATVERVGQSRGAISTYEPTHIVKARAEKAEDADVRGRRTA